MPDQADVVDPGVGGTPNPPVSKPPIEDAETLSKRLEEVLASQNRLEKELGGLQKRQDKAENSQRAFLEEYERQKATGKSSADAESAATQIINERSAAQKRDTAIDLLLRKEGLLPDQPAGSGAAGVVDVAKVVEQLDLDPADPEVAVASARRFENEEQAYATMAKVLAGKKAKPTPSEADRTATPGKPGAPETPTQEGYIKEMRAVPRGSSGDSIRAAIAARYRKAGVDTFNVDFT